METDGKMPPQSEQLQILKVASSDNTGFVEEFHVVISNASVPGLCISASCHANHIAAEEAREVLWRLSQLVNVKE